MPTNSACLAHASQPLLEQHPADPPQLRHRDRQHGIDCRVCHQVGCGYAGPYQRRIGPHPVRQNTTRLPCSSFCGACHKVEQKEYEALYVSATAGEGILQCAQCHINLPRAIDAGPCPLTSIRNASRMTMRFPPGPRPSRRGQSASETRRPALRTANPRANRRVSN